MKSTARTCQEYFDLLPENRKEPLLRLRRMIRGVWPDIEEDLDRDMPTYHLRGRVLCALANQKDNMVFYVMPHDLLNAFKKDLLIHDRGRTCIRFKRLEPETYDLFDRIVKYTGTQLEESRLADSLITRRRVALKA